MVVGILSLCQAELVAGIVHELLQPLHHVGEEVAAREDSDGSTVARHREMANVLGVQERSTLPNVSSNVDAHDIGGGNICHRNFICECNYNCH